MKKVYNTPILKMESFEMDFDIMLESIVPNSILWNQFKEAFERDVFPTGSYGPDMEMGFKQYLADMGYDDGNSGFCVFTDVKPS